MNKQISILGSTGSIGTQSLEVCEKHGIKITALAAHSSTELLERQARKFRPEYVGIYNETKYNEMKERLADTDIKVLCGMEGLCRIAGLSQNDIVLNSVVGMVGLLPTLTAIKAGKDVALANKETLVAGGEIVMSLAKEKGVRIYPVDSEHSAIFQCLAGERARGVEKLILTASGGPFRGRTREELRGVTPEEALRHPNWKMGAKVTIDSASMMNKGFEVMEARWLFGMPVERIGVVVHPQSIVHSMVQFTDGSIKAQLGVPDMRLPIQYALAYPERVESDFGRVDFGICGQLTFEEPDRRTFRNLDLAYRAMERGGNAPCVLNAANEVAVEAFLQGRCSFTGMSELIERTMEAVEFVSAPALEDYVASDAEGRRRAEEYVKDLRE